MNKKIITQSFLIALEEGIYVALVALLMQNSNALFGKEPDMLGVVAFLLLFVLSAVISGTLILGKPILMYLD